MVASIPVPSALLLTSALAGLTGCQIDDEPAGCEAGVIALGCGEHDVSALEITVIGTRDDGLDVPRDLGINPDDPSQIWTVNRGDDSVVIFTNPGLDDQDAEHIVDPYAMHFMEEASSIAFGAPGRFATCQESRNTYDHSMPGNDFMGPALWSSDPDIFGHSNPEAIAEVGEDLGSHVDMLHESPDCMGIAWEEDNVYWVFDGFHRAIVRYDFRADHGPGYDDHSDGRIARYVEGEVERLSGVPSHLVLDPDARRLYIVDTGNNRIAVLETRSGERGEDLAVDEPGTEHYQVDGATLETLIDGDDADLRRPSGIALHEGVLYVTDQADGEILAFSEDGELLDWVDTEREGARLMGIEIDAAGNLWVVDADADELIRITPRAED